MLQTALQFLRNHNEIAFATCEGNLPKIRVFQIMKQEGTVLYFATYFLCLNNQSRTAAIL